MRSCFTPSIRSFWTRTRPRISSTIVAYAQKLAEGEGRSRLYMRVWARDLKAEGFAKKCRFRKAETAPVEVLPGTTLDITTWEMLWR